ncbi:MAG: hypothetical protein EOP33_02130 [Rickettsiaceae bacterium]|nr:MAG: hypothetical protein EOP33_02130 [Rickettsiaceae bacterium]
MFHRQLKAKTGTSYVYKNYYEYLHQLVKNGDTNIAELDNMDFEDSSGVTLLHVAASLDHIEMVRFLIANGGNVGAKNKEGKIPLHNAVSKGYIDIVKVLIEAGSGVNASDNNERTPLHLAAEHGRIEIVRLLITNGGNVHANDKEGNTPLHLAAEHGRIEIVRLLITNGGNVHANNKEGNTPLHDAASNGCTDTVRVLIEVSSDVNASDNNERTPLHDAASNGCTDTVRLLIEAGCDVNATDIDDLTPLHWATYNRNTDVITTLITQGANVYATDKYGNTVLHKALISFQKPVIIKLLSIAPQLLFIENQKGKVASASDYARHTNTISLLNEAENIYLKVIQDNSLDSTSKLVEKIEIKNFSLLNLMLCQNIKQHPPLSTDGKIKMLKSKEVLLKQTITKIELTQEQQQELTTNLMGAKSQFIDDSGIPTLKYLAAAAPLISSLKILAATDKDSEQQEQDLIDVIYSQAFNMPQQSRDDIVNIANFYPELFAEIAKTHPQHAKNLFYVMTCTDEQREQFKAQMEAVDNITTIDTGNNNVETAITSLLAQSIDDNDHNTYGHNIHDSNVTDHTVITETSLDGETPPFNIEQID